MYYNVLKWENRFTLGLDTAKITNVIEKYFKRKLLRIKFPTKNSAGAHVYLSQKLSLGVQRLSSFRYYIVLKWDYRFALELSGAKISEYIEKRFK